MRVFVILALVISLVPRPTDAKNIGVLVTGEYLKGPTQQQAEKWLTAKGHKVVTNPLPAEAVKTLLNCFVLDDSKCMRGVVEARSSTPTLVSIRVDVASKKAREIRLTIDWFAKGHSPASARRTCDKCTEDVLRSTLDAMLEDLAKTAPGFTGSVKITSDPAGMTILMDNKTVGVTPLELQVPTGSHSFKLVHDGRTGPEQTVDVGDQSMDLTLEGPPAATPIGDVPPTQPVVVGQRRSRLIPGLMIGIGLAGVGAGAALYLTSEEPDGSSRTYRDTKNLGIGVAAGGAALALTGVIIILATKSTTGPTVSMTPGGAQVGWAGSF